jgi:formate hydrogenlyase subunit 3/multisubunit Na+/H+ antiporter MnhD subunit
MEIIAGDIYYNKARHLIQNHFDNPVLSAKSRERIGDLYSLITVQNAKSVYDEVQSLFERALIEYNRQLQMSHLRFLGLISLVITSIGYFGAKCSFKYVGRDWFYYLYEKIMHIGMCGTFLTVLGTAVVYFR